MFMTSAVHHLIPLPHPILLQEIRKFLFIIIIRLLLFTPLSTFFLLCLSFGLSHLTKKITCYKKGDGCFNFISLPFSFSFFFYLHLPLDHHHQKSYSSHHHIGLHCFDKKESFRISTYHPSFDDNDNGVYIIIIILCPLYSNCTPAF